MPTKEDLKHRLASAEQLDRMMEMYNREIPEDQTPQREIDEEELERELAELEQELEEDLAE